ncbi:MarR family winged helix-turn-helix transcriptional regulator [Paenibacillus tarimensis]
MTEDHTSKTRTDYAERFHKAILATNRKVVSWISARLEDGLTIQQCFILQQIADDERTTSSLLAERMEVKPSAITVIIDRLVQNGFVERLADQGDRRVTLLKLSEKGVAALKKVQNQFHVVNRRILEVLDESEVEPLIRSFERIAEAASKLEEME